MADTTVSSPAPRKRGRWLRIIIGVLGIFVILIVAVYFVGTSSAFFKGFILPRVSKSMNAQVTVSEASIHPFKDVTLHNFQVRTTGEEPLVSAAEVRARYSLMDIIGGNIHVEEAALASPTIVLVENPDGTSNLDPILKGKKEAPNPKEKQAQPSKPSKPTHLDVRKIALTDGTVRRIKLYKNGNRDVMELSHVNVTADDLKNGQSGNLALSAEIKMENHPPAPETNGLLHAKLNGNFTFALSPDLKPVSVQGKIRTEITEAAGGMAELATLAADLNCEVTPTDIKQVALQFQKAGARLGEVRVNGPFDMEKTEGRLTVQILALDKQVLNLAGAKSGIDFGPTLVNSTNEIQLTKSGTAITAAGALDLTKLQLTRAQQTTPMLDIRAEYNVSVDRSAQNALLRNFTLTGNQKGNPLLRAELTSPMTLAWGNVTNAVGDSALNLTVTHLNLADWKAFAGDAAPAGDANLKLSLLSQQAGKKLTFDLDSHIDNLTAGTGSNQISQANVILQVKGDAADLKVFNLGNYKLQLTRQNQALVSASGSGTYDTAAQTADLQMAAQVMIAKLLQVMPRSDVDISSGTAELKVHIVQTAQGPASGPKSALRNITGNLALADLTGKFGKNEFHSFGSTMDLDVGMTPQQIQVRKLTGKLTQGPNAGGTFDATATVETTNNAAQFTAKLTDFNQNGLGPVLQPMLAEKKLVSVAINATASGHYDPKGDSAIKADLQLANLVVNDPSNQFPATPLEAKMQIDASIHNQVADVRQFQLGLTPTQRGKNELQLKGQVDMSKTNGIEGNLKLTSDSMDLTSYYDLFAGGKKPDVKQTPAARGQSQPSAQHSDAAPPQQAAAEKEPDPKSLPFRNFTADVNIGRFYLREVEITNLQTTAKIDGGKVAVKPLQLSLNGAPVSSTVQLNLGIPGYAYDINFNATQVPLAPLVNSFVPEKRDQVKGALTAQAQVSGTGTTGPSLQKSLTGQFDIGTTNLGLSIPQLKSKLMKTIVNVIAVVPELIKNPTGAVGSLLGSALGGGSGGGSWVNELQQSPIDVIQARGTMGSGRVDLERALVQSAAFQAETHGTVTLADVLTNSTLNLPLGVSVRRGLAEKINMVPAGTPTNAVYAKLPDYVSITGTIGDPKEKINKAALLGTALQQLGGNIPVNKQTGNLIQGLGGLLTGRQTTTTTNAAPNTTTNQPPAPQSPVNNLLDQLLKPKKKP